MNMREAELDYERRRELDASSGRDSRFDRIATRDDGADDNGEPLCTSPEISPAIKRGMLAGSFLDIVRSQHHINTEHP
jgi:hypothetical protein